MSVFIVCLFVCLFGKPVARLAKIKGPFSTMGFTVFNRGTCPKTIQFYKARPIRVMHVLDLFRLLGTVRLLCCVNTMLICLCVCVSARTRELPISWPWSSPSTTWPCSFPRRSWRRPRPMLEPRSSPRTSRSESWCS